MNTYSQNREDLIIAEYFGDFKGTLLSIGENDGRTFSNALAFIELGWQAHLVEPSSVFRQMESAHIDNKLVTCYNFGIGDSDRYSIFYESGAHVRGGKDRALVSTTDESELTRWVDVEFTKKEIDIVSWFTFLCLSGSDTVFDYISIDCEGMDLEILKQINLSQTKCLIIEWNGVLSLKSIYQDICDRFGLRLFHKNAENLIFVR
jgi:hypothetical protein